MACHRTAESAGQIMFVGQNLMRHERASVRCSEGHRGEWERAAACEGIRHPGHGEGKKP